MNDMICTHRNYTKIYNFDKSSLYRCDECRLIFTDRFLEIFDPKTLYEKFYKNEIPSRFSFGIEYVIKVFRFFRAFKIYSIQPSAKSILDIGSGRGFMLYFLKKYYKFSRTVGTQISPKAFKFSREKLKLEIYDKDLFELSFDVSNFDIVTMFHVLEHVREPEKYIERIHKLLKNHGRLLIEVPNFNSWTRNLTKQYWLGLDLNYHLTFFTPETLTCLLRKYHFKIKSIHTFSLEYSTFISTQSLISLLTRSDHVFFQYIQISGFNPKLILHAFLFLILAPFCFLINVLLYFSRKGEVLLMIAEKG